MNGYVVGKTSGRVLGIVGSLRDNSFNRSLLDAAASFLPESIEFEIFDIGDIPHYNQDVEDSRIPEIVGEFRQKVRDADAILIATPEYNGSITGALKDALDWASRPYGESSFEGKPIAILIGVAGRGGQSVLNHLTRIIDYLDARILGEPVVIRHIAQKFDARDRLVDPEIVSQIERLVESIGEVVLPNEDKINDTAIREAVIAEANRN